MAHSGWLLFAWVLADQIGLPLPAAPALLAAGVLVRSDRMHPFAAIGIAAVASIIGHTVWYEAGRRRGRAVLRWICRISIEPDACVRRGENLLARGSTRTLLVAHFIPGLDLVAQPLAALAGLSRARYLAITAAGALLWAGTFTAVGYAFGHTLANAASTIGAVLGVVAAVAFVAYLLWKLIVRYRLLASLRVARVKPEELAALISAGATPFVIDMRHPTDFAARPLTIAGAVHIPSEELEARIGEIPRDRDIILYCT